MHTPFCYDLKIVLKKRLEKIFTSLLGSEMRFPSFSSENEFFLSKTRRGCRMFRREVLRRESLSGILLFSFGTQRFAYQVLACLFWKKEGVCSLLMTTRIEKMYRCARKSEKEVRHIKTFLH